MAGTSFFLPMSTSSAEMNVYNPAAISTSAVERREERNAIGTNAIVRTSRWHAYVVQRFTELESGMFDFTDLRIPPPSAIERAKSIATDTFRPDTPTPSVVPSEDGSVLFVWHKAGWDVELEVSESTASVWAHHREDSSTWHGSLSECSAEFDQLLRDFAHS